MKKVLMAVVCVTAICLGAIKTNAQTASPIKIAVFDLDLMVRALPEYRGIDSLTQSFERDTLGQEYQIYLSEYQRLDSTWKADSAAKKPQTVLDYTRNQEMQMAYQLQYWQQIAQNKSDQYRGQLAAPLYQKVVVAYKKVLAAKKYTLILKPEAYEVGTQVENMFPLVAKEMNVTLPPGLTIDPNQALNEAGNTAPPPSVPAPRAGRP